MGNISTYIKGIAALVGGGLSALLGGWDMALSVLVLFVVLDFLTGMTAAWYEGKLDSNIGLRKIPKKILIFVVVTVGYWMDRVIGQEVLRNLVIFFYLANEGLSILENIVRAGVDLPPPIRDALAQMKQKTTGPDKN